MKLKQFKTVMVATHSATYLPTCVYEHKALDKTKEIIRNKIDYFVENYKTKTIYVPITNEANIGGLSMIVIRTVLEYCPNVHIVVAKSSNTSFNKLLDKIDVEFLSDLIQSKGIEIMEFDDIDEAKVHEHIIPIVSAVCIFNGPTFTWKPLLNAAIYNNKDLAIVPFNKKDSDILECDSHGDLRFSAYFANIKTSNGNEIIENIYQNTKIKTPNGLVVGFKIGNQVINVKYWKEFYKYLWVRYFIEHPLAYDDACQYNYFHDKFAKKRGMVNQGNTIAEIVRDGLIESCGRVFSVIDVEL